jgi:hypothetical protein
MWTSGNELVYVNVDAKNLVSARLEFGPTTTVMRTTLFSYTNFTSIVTSARSYDVSRDGKSFVIVRSQAPRAAADPIIVLNWGEEVRRLMTAAQVKQ